MDDPDRDFIDGLERFTARVGRGLLIGLPALFLVGLAILPLGLPGLVALPIVVIGAVAISLLAERFRMISRGERPARRAKRELSASAYLMMIGAIAAVAVYVVFLLVVGGGGR